MIYVGFGGMSSAWGPVEATQACYEASEAGYVVHRAFAEWGIACAVIAPSLIPTKPGVQRKYDKCDAAQVARDMRPVWMRRDARVSARCQTDRLATENGPTR